MSPPPRKKKRKRIQGTVRSSSEVTARSMRTPKRVVYPSKLPAATDVVAIECPVCADIVWSRHVHDFRPCRCNYCFIDGGRDYSRIGWGNESIARPWPSVRYLTLRVSKDIAVD